MKNTTKKKIGRYNYLIFIGGVQVGSIEKQSDCWEVDSNDCQNFAEFKTLKECILHLEKVFFKMKR